jgi:Flp pilus assembly protein TadD
MERSTLRALLLALVLCFAACARPLARDPLAAGVAAARDDRWEEAVRHWQLAIVRNLRSAAAHNNLAVALERQGAFEEAGRAYETALRLNPDNAAIKGNYASFKARLEAGRARRP